MNASLAPDMLPLARQVQIASVTTACAILRHDGVEPGKPDFPGRQPSA